MPFGSVILDSDTHYGTEATTLGTKYQKSCHTLDKLLWYDMYHNLQNTVPVFV
jgi:hypothetical protein